MFFIKILLKSHFDILNIYLLITEYFIYMFIYFIIYYCILFLNNLINFLIQFSVAHNFVQKFYLNHFGSIYFFINIKNLNNLFKFIIFLMIIILIFVSSNNLNFDI